jgi:hypothetical protein
MALTLAGGLLEGHIRNRWGPSETMLAAAEKLAEFPHEFGGFQNNRWQMQASQTMSQDVIDTLECTGYFVRTYANPRTGESVNVFVIVGPAGPISVHTPEICYSSQDYVNRSPRECVAITDDAQANDEFWALSFKSKDVRGDVLRVYYAWSTGNHWRNPNDARYAFAGWPYLYKVQLAATMPPGADLKKGDTCQSFLRDFVPVARQYLIEPSTR